MYKVVGSCDDMLVINTLEFTADWGSSSHQHYSPMYMWF